MATSSSAALLLLGALALAGCTGKPCADNARDPFVPTSDFACPSNQLCYLGECQPACNAGAERSQLCESDNDCTHPSRPRCIDRFCSGCEEGKACVPRLNICAPVGEVVPSNMSRDANFMGARATTPQDGGWIDGSVFERDLGVRERRVVPISHRGTVDIYDVRRYVSGSATRQSGIDVEIYDLRQTRLTESATITGREPPTEVRFACEVRTNRRFTSTASIADLGRITVRNPPLGMNVMMDTTSGLLPAGPMGTYEFPHDASGYRSTTPLPTNLLVNSSTLPAALRYVEVFGTGQAMATIRPFPTESESYHVPYPLIPGRNANLDTDALLRGGVQVQRPAAAPIALIWPKPRRVSGVQIQARIDGPTHHIRCVADDQTERLEIVSSILNTFVNANRLAPGTTLTLRFERAFSKQMSVDSDLDMGVNVELSVNIRTGFATPIRFE